MPQTIEGAQAWDVLLRSSGQFRRVLAGDRLITIGLDMIAALAIAAHLGYDVPAVCDLLPSLEAGAVAGLNAEGPLWQSRS